MLFSEINEAFDNTIKNNYNEDRDRARHEQLYNEVEQDRDEIMRSLNIDPNNIHDIQRELHIEPAKGTSIASIINKSAHYPLLDDDVLSGNSDGDSVFSEVSRPATPMATPMAPSCKSPQQSPIKSSLKSSTYSHDYYINKFITDIYNEDIASKLSITSNISRDDNAIYKHVRKCNYCKDQIKARFAPKNMTEKFTQDTDNSSQVNWKELLIILLIGVILILFLDFSVKIFKCVN